MESAAAKIWEASTCLWRRASKHAAYIFDVKENLDSLRKLDTELQNMYHDVKRSVEQAEASGHMRRTHQVDGWLQRVYSMEEAKKDILEEGAQEVQNKCCVTCCPKNCVSSYKLGKKILKMLKNMEELMATGKSFTNNDDIAYKLPHVPVDELPVQTTVGLDAMLMKVWDCIQEGNTNLIGLYGMGGAGKTTLLKRINNEFVSKAHDFSIVIWAVVSKDFQIEKLRDVIRRRLEIGDSIWNSRNEDARVAEIYKVMKQKKFILLLDDIWEQFDLQELGIPLLQDHNQSKILFTTRFEDVCDRMKAQKKFKVECLTDKEALDLFCMHAGEDTLYPPIRELAKQVVSECKGLPLALITVGRAMASRKRVEAWNHAIKELGSFPSKVLDMEKKVLSTMRFSYDRLPSETHKICFLYCALFPEDFEIEVEDLIDLWVGEGFLDEHDSIYDAYNHGKFVIESLKLASLLESIEYSHWSYPKVKMHDVIRDMALWIVHDEDQNKNKVLVQGEAVAATRRSMFGDNLQKWQVVQRISMMYIGGDQWIVPTCRNLLTLILRNSFTRIDFSNFQSLSLLKVLDLSGNKSISRIPNEIGQLIHLEFLNMSRMRDLERLPMELKNLKNLRMFLMEDTNFTLEIIPLEVISNLEGLRVFRFYPDHPVSEIFQKEKEFLEKLESLPILEELSMALETSTGLKKLLGPTKLQLCIRQLLLVETTVSMPSLLAAMSKMKHLDFIYFVDIHHNVVEDLPFNDSYHFGKLRWVHIQWCHSLTHLTWLKYAPLLESLKLYYCKSIQELIKGPEDEDDDEKERENADMIFPSLEVLFLKELPQLKSIHRRSLAFPSLRYIYIRKCPTLKNFLFDSNSAKYNRLREIQGDKHWWDNLEWEDQATMHSVHSKFKVI